jgi:hypothetical protein
MRFEISTYLCPVPGALTNNAGRLLLWPKTSAVSQLPIACQLTVWVPAVDINSDARHSDAVRDRPAIPAPQGSPGASWCRWTPRSTRSPGQPGAGGFDWWTGALGPTGPQGTAGGQGLQQWGSASVTPSGTTVTFPKPYTAAPAVVVTGQAGGPLAAPLLRRQCPIWEYQGGTSQPNSARSTGRAGWALHALRSSRAGQSLWACDTCTAVWTCWTLQSWRALGARSSGRADRSLQAVDALQPLRALGTGRTGDTAVTRALNECFDLGSAQLERFDPVASTADCSTGQLFLGYPAGMWCPSSTPLCGDFMR